MSDLKQIVGKTLIAAGCDVFKLELINLSDEADHLTGGESQHLSGIDFGSTALLKDQVPSLQLAYYLPIVDKTFCSYYSRIAVLSNALKLFSIDALPEPTQDSFEVFLDVNRKIVHDLGCRQLFVQTYRVDIVSFLETNNFRKGINASGQEIYHKTF